VVVVWPAAALAQGGPPIPGPVDRPEGFAEVRAKYEGLSRDVVVEAGYEIPPECVAVPGIGGMGYHATHPERYQEQFEAGEMDAEHPPILLLDKDYVVRGLEWEAKDIGQGELELYGQTVELQPGHPGVEEPHYMLHAYFRPDGKVLLISSASVPPFDPELECLPGMPGTGAGGMAGGGLPLGSTAATLSLLMASGYVVLALCDA